MHYYNRNLGDYAKKAGRLSMLQHGAYTLLLDACYDRERFPAESEAIEWTWASTPDEEQAVRFVLSRFFERQEDGTYVQSRVRDELLMFKIGGIQNRLIAISREAKKQKRDQLAGACDQLRAEIKHDPLAKTHDAWTSVVDALVKQHEPPPNQEPITNNQEPIPKPLTSEAAASDAQAGDDPGIDPEDLPPEPKHTPEDYRLAEWMAQHVARVAPKSKPPKLDSWADTIRLMRERDNHTHRDIAEVFSFANNDSFWSVNILSPAKLREKFGELDAKMRRTTNEKPNPSGGGANPPKQTAAQRIAARRQQLASGPSPVGDLAADDRDVWPSVDQPAGGGAERYLASGTS